MSSSQSNTLSSRRYSVEELRVGFSAGANAEPATSDLPEELQTLATLKPKVDVTTEQLRKMLTAIDAEPYQDWIFVGMALHHQYDGDAEGFELWDDWSATASNYQAGEPEKKWPTFKPKGVNPKTAAYILDKAKKQGYSESIPAKAIKAAPYKWIAPEQIPRRQWLYKPHYIRKFLSATVAPGGLGKSSLVMTECLAMTSGRPLLGIQPERRLKAWYWNLEDPMEELQRRFQAISKQYDLTPRDLEGRLFVNSGRENPLCIAKTTRDGTMIAEPAVEGLVNEIRAKGIDVLIIDPFVASHRVTENDNDQIEIVAQQWAHIADATNCSVHLVHHTRKTNGGRVSAEDSRGGKALVDKARDVRVLNSMETTDARKWGIENASCYVQVASGKANLGVKASGWIELKSVCLDNDDLSPDEIGVPVSWKPPIDSNFLAPGDIKRIQEAVDESVPEECRKDERSPNWVGFIIARVLNFDSDLKKPLIKKLIGDLLQNKKLEEVTIRTEKGKNVQAVVVGEWADDLE